MRRTAAVIVLSMIVAACGGSATTDATEAPATEAGGTQTTTAPATTAAAAAATTTAAGGGELRDDIPPACALATTEEVAALFDVEISAGETMGGECSYEFADGSNALFLTVGAFPVPTGECADWIPTEPLFEEETVAPAPGYGDAAAIVTAEARTDYFVCASGAAVSVEMLGPEGMTAAEHQGIAAAILELALGRL